MFSTSGSFFPHWSRPSWTSPSSPVLNHPSSYEIPVFANAAYYPNWRIYRGQAPSSFKLGFISHIFYAFAWIKDDGTVYLSDEWADSQMPVDGTRGCLRAFALMKKQYPKLKVILSIGGGGKGSENFALVARYPSRAETFVRTARELVDQFHLDGVDIDWEHPSDPLQGADYVNLLFRVRQGLPAPRYFVSTCLPAGEWALQHIDLLMAQNYLDLINIMAYDFSGPWTHKTGHQSQLYSSNADLLDTTSCKSGISYVLSRGVSSKKILLGVPTYGRSFLGSDDIGQSYTGHGGEDGTFDYCDLPRPGATEHHDEETGAAYCTGGDGGFVSYDTPQTVKQKAKFVTQMQLGGMFYWQIASDAKGPRSLIETGYNTMHDM